MNKELTIISIRAYAKLKEVSDTSIRKMKGKRLGDNCWGVNPKNNRPFLYKELADVDWVNNHNPAYERETKGDKEKNNGAAAGINKKAAGTGIHSSNKTYAEQKGKREEIEFHLAAIRLREKTGELVEKAKVYEALFSFAADFRAGLQDLPDQILDNLLAAGSRDEAYDLFTAAIDNKLMILTTVNSTIKI